jgi:hypothetical protein
MKSVLATALAGGPRKAARPHGQAGAGDWQMIFYFALNVQPVLPLYFAASPLINRWQGSFFS